MAIRITALGTARVQRDGRDLDRLPAQRIRFGVLLYLAVEREASREVVMGLFWPDRPPDRARHLLSQTLYELRQELGDAWVRSVGEHLRVADDVVVDVTELTVAVESGAYERALELYGGRLLGGAPVGETHGLEDWAERQQARLTRLHRQARRGAVDAAVERGDPRAALAIARGWVELEPLDDEAHHRLIELLAAVGDRAGALRQYDRYAALVRRELELEPLDSMRELVDRIRAGNFGDRPAGGAAPEPGGRPVPEVPAAPPPASAEPAHAPPARLHGLRVAALLALVVSAAVVGRVLLPTAGAAGDLDPRRVAVLFFDDHSATQDLGPVAAGFTEALIHELDQVDGLEILSRTAVEAYRYRKPPLDSLVAALRAGTFVEGSITRVGDSLKVTFQLVDGATASHMLSGTLTRPADEVAALSREIPQRVALRLRERLGTEVVLREVRSGTEDSEAWLLVQRAQVLLEDARATSDDDLPAALRLLDRADSMLAEAESADPHWPEPAVRRALVERFRGGQTAKVPGQINPKATRRAMRHLERALARDPAFVPALEHRGIFRLELAEAAEDLDQPEFRDLLAEAEADLRNAVALDVQRARAWWGLSRVLRRKGSFAEAKQAARRALAADAFLEVPVEGLFQLFHTSFEREEHAEAVEWCQELRRRRPGAMRRIQCELILMASSPAAPPEPARAWALVDTMVAMGGPAEAPIYRGWATLYVAKALAREGLEDSARRVLKRTVPDPPPAWSAYDAAHLCLMLGDVPGALRYLEAYLEVNPEQASYLTSDWWFREIHDDPRFLALVQRGGKPLRR